MCLKGNVFFHLSFLDHFLKLNVTVFFEKYKSNPKLNWIQINFCYHIIFRKTLANSILKTRLKRYVRKRHVIFRQVLSFLYMSFLFSNQPLVRRNNAMHNRSFKSYPRIVNCPILEFTRRKNGIKNDTNEMNTGGNQEYVAPFIFNFFHGRVIFGDLLSSYGTYHSGECAYTIADTH